MPQVSRRFLKKETAHKINRLFLETITNCSSVDSASDFLDDLLTPTEKIMLSKRLAAAYLLVKGYPYNLIGNFLKLSNSTIRSVSLILKIQGNGLRRELEKMRKRDNLHKFFDELADSLIEILGTGKGSDWRATKSLLHHRKAARQLPL